MLIMNVVAGIIFIYVGIFVNLYIWEQGQNIFDVSWFNFNLFLFWGFAYAIGSRLLGRSSIRLLVMLSACFGALAFVLLSTLTIENRMLWIAIIGLPVGVMQGLFSAAQNISVTMLGKSKEFGPYFAATNIITQVLNMTVPLLSAQAIRLFDYSGSFVLMLAFVGLMLFFATRLPRISLREHLPANKSWFEQMRLGSFIVSSKSKWFIISCLAAGFILQFQSLFALLFTFSVTENKTVVALLNMCYTLFALMALVAYRRLRLQERAWLVLSVILLGAGLMLMLIPIPTLRIISNIVTTVGMFYFGTILTAQQLRVTVELDVGRRAHLLVWREWLFCISRMVMLLIALSIDTFNDPMFLALALLVVCCLLGISFVQAKMIGKQEPGETSAGA